MMVNFPFSCALIQNGKSSFQFAILLKNTVYKKSLFTWEIDCLQMNASVLKQHIKQTNPNKSI